MWKKILQAQLGKHAFYGLIYIHDSPKFLYQSLRPCEKILRWVFGVVQYVNAKPLKTLLRCIIEGF